MIVYRLFNTNLRPDDIETLSDQIYAVKMKSRKYDGLSSAKDDFPCALAINIDYEGNILILVDDETEKQGKVKQLEDEIRKHGKFEKEQLDDEVFRLKGRSVIA